MRGIAGVSLVALIVGMMAAAVSAQGTPVVPGQSIGDFRVGEDLPSVIAVLGPLHSQSDFAGGTFIGYYWPLKRVGVIADKQTGIVAAVVVSLDDTYQTEKGVAAGTDIGTVRTAYGKEDGLDNTQDDSTVIYDKLGVAFVVDKGGALENRVSLIFVFDPGRYHEIFVQ